MCESSSFAKLECWMTQMKLRHAVDVGDEDVVRKCLRASPMALSQSDERGWTALHVLASLGVQCTQAHVVIAKLLLSAGAERGGQTSDTFCKQRISLLSRWCRRPLSYASANPIPSRPVSDNLLDIFRSPNQRYNSFRSDSAIATEPFGLPQKSNDLLFAVLACSHVYHSP